MSVSVIFLQGNYQIYIDLQFSPEYLFIFKEYSQIFT